MKKQILLILPLVILVLGACDDFLDRSSLTEMNDDTYWTTENNLRLFSNGFYSNYFVGYNSGWGSAYAPLRGYYFSDDFSSTGKLGSFETQAPSSRADDDEVVSMMNSYAGPTWNFAWVRKANVFMERIAAMQEAGVELSEETFQHWTAAARFFRGFEYSRLVSVFGDVPYYGEVINDSNLDELYKDRDDRTFVMDQVYDDFVYVMDNMRTSDGNAQYLNRYIAASFISRLMLFEGTWQKYHLNNTEKASKYLELAADAADFVMSSGMYSFTSDFRSLFGSQDLAGNKEVILFRHYDASIGITHHVASYSNLTEGQYNAPNLSLAKAFICTDGKPYQLSAVPNADELSIQNLAATRDPRFEATFWDAPKKESSTLLYACKFIDRVGVTYYGSTYPSMYGSNTNTNDAPVMRLGEVVLNWIEAKAELATMGGAAVTQADLDVSINAIRSRPLDAVAIEKGIQQTAPLLLAELPDDPARDADVSALIWEIRRERRMEFVYEHSRLLDIKRWNKIDYMSGADNPDILRGPWIDFEADFPEWLVEEKEGVLRVETADGTVVTYNGSNAAEMVGYYVPENVSDRDPFTDRVYLAPVGNAQISEYMDKGYTLSQTPGWE
ncbi:RagB/SusD family nutrient uptake outer membrane protein [Sunxiuqinia rutila]|uniref:RagB/SusD family nutrient uptake outer membrane protein n=1 Tax=Sunxiuqinia rutila TaxID=1397841 RepID=UPI003D364B87